MKSQKIWNLEPNASSGRLASSWRGNWLVLRCSNRNTLPLVVAMEHVGLQAWTPLWIRDRRYPRSSKSRKVLLPCLPSFVFLAEIDVTLALAAAAGNGVPGFSIMNSYGVLVRIKDDALDSLRKVTDLNPHKDNPAPWPNTGDVRQIVSGAFQGLTCIVRGRTGRHCLVQIEGSKFPLLKIPPFLLTEDEA